MENLTHQIRASANCKPYDPKQAEQTDQTDQDESRFSYLRPNRYFKFYLFRQKKGAMTCWLPEGFCV